jgi:hypothetical protein
MSEEILLTNAYNSLYILSDKNIRIENNIIQTIEIDFDDTDSIALPGKVNDVFLFVNFEYHLNFSDYCKLLISCSKKVSLSNSNQMIICTQFYDGLNNKILRRYNKLKKTESHISKLPFWAVHFFKTSKVYDKGNLSKPENLVFGIIEKILNSAGVKLMELYKPVKISVMTKAMAKAPQHIKDGVHNYYYNVLEQEER